MVTASCFPPNLLPGLRDARQIAEAVLEIAARVLDRPDSDFLLVDEARGELYVVAKRAELRGAAGLRQPLDGEKGITVAAARSGRPVYVPDVRQDPRYVSIGFPAVSELAVPVQIEDRVLGVLNGESGKRRFPNIACNSPRRLPPAFARRLCASALNLSAPTLPPPHLAARRRSRCDAH